MADNGHTSNDASNGNQNDIFQPTDYVSCNAHVKDMKKYHELYKLSVDDPEKFWCDIAKDFHWEKWFTGDFCKYNFKASDGDISIKFMEGAKTNICYNVLDRIVKDKGLGGKVAFYWEGNELGESEKYTYSDILKQVCKFANVLKSKGVKKGDRIAIYMPMVIELVVAMLACARLGAIHSIVFAGFSADSLAERMIDGQCSMIITADGFVRGPKYIGLKTVVDDALIECANSGLQVKNCIVLNHVGKASSDSPSSPGNPPTKRHCAEQKIAFNSSVDSWWHELMSDASEECEVEWMDAEDPLFILYTSGSTGKPKGVLHTTGGYMMYTATTFKYTFDYHENDTYWCTADIGWITGHSYIVYGPMANGATSVLFAGTPMYPDASRCWAVVEKYQVNSFYTAPTAIRALMKYPLEHITKHNLSSLRILGTVGEPINPEAWLWYYNNVGKGKASVVDTFWQTETGGHVITGVPGATSMKPGSASRPFFGVIPAVVDEEGKELEGVCDQGYLVFKRPWPGMMRTLYANHERFQAGYFKRFDGYYCAGDGCRRDEDGYYWITGRIDDCMNVSGHLLSTAQIESALVEHRSLAEAAVVSIPHPVKGECIYCFVTLKEDQEFSKDLIKELKEQVRHRIGAIASPEIVQNAPGLPKTRSGKIMRRILRKIARNERDIGDSSTLADPQVVEQLFDNRPEFTLS